MSDTLDIEKNIDEAVTLLTTDRLELIVPDLSYLSVMLDHMERNKEHFKTSSPRVEKFYTKAFWEQRLEQIPEDFKQKRSLYLILQKKNSAKNIIGSLCFDNIVRGPFHACYLGYRMDKDYVRDGYMTEALSEAIKYAQNELKIHRIMANYRPENTASGKVLQKLGFTIEGYAKKYLFLDGEWQDHILTSLTNDAIESITI